MKWAVWFVTYATCAEVELTGDVPPRKVAGKLTLEAAQRIVAERGFGYCVKPE